MSTFPRATRTKHYCPNCYLSKRNLLVKLRRLNLRVLTFECPNCGLRKTLVWKRERNFQRRTIKKGFRFNLEEKKAVF